MSGTPRGATVTEMFEQCVGCKWTLHLLGEIRRGRSRPGQLERSAPGLTTKVMNERLTKLVRFGVLEKRSYPEKPPRVEYELSPLGRRFVVILDDIDRLRHDLEHDRILPRAVPARVYPPGQGALPLVAAPPPKIAAAKRPGPRARSGKQDKGSAARRTTASVGRRRPPTRRGGSR